MNTRPHRSRKWRRFLHQNRGYFFMSFFLALILLLVAVIFWAMSSADFVKPR